MIKILLDTNIIIHREASRVINKDIGLLFKCFDNLGYEKWIHQLTIEEIQNHKDPVVVGTMQTKVQNYNLHTIDSIDDALIKTLRVADKNVNDENDTSILKEVYTGRFDYLITEDRNLHKKAEFLSIGERVFTIDSFLEKVNTENPQLIDYRVLAVKKMKFGKVNLSDPFFDSFKTDYNGFENWFQRKAEELSYVCITDNSVRAFLFLKTESLNENYADISPTFPNKKRLKIGTFKVESIGFKLGERFLKIIFDNALISNVDEIYVTIFGYSEEQKRLISLLKDWGFMHWGEKTSSNGTEQVFIRNMKIPPNIKEPKLSFPIISKNTNKYIVPIYPEYHTSLLPDSILNNESPADFVENEPYRNAMQKVYVSRSINRNLKPGDLIVFYRTGGYYHSVVSTIGVVESTVQINDIRDESHFIQLCRKRSVFSDKELQAQWNYNRNNRPFIVNFLHVYSLPNRINMKRLIELNVISNVNSAPRGFEPISDAQFNSIILESRASTNFLL